MSSNAENTKFIKQETPQNATQSAPTCKTYSPKHSEGSPKNSSSMHNLRSASSTSSNNISPKHSRNNKAVEHVFANTNFGGKLVGNSPSLPPQMQRKLTCKDNTSVGKVKVLLKVSQGGEVPGSNRVLSVDNRRRCVTLYDPAAPTNAPIPTTVTPTKIIECASPSTVQNKVLSKPETVVVACHPVRETVIGADEDNSNEEDSVTSTAGNEDTVLNGHSEQSAGQTNKFPVVRTVFEPREDHLCSATIKGVSAPKMFSFDGIFTYDDSQTELCSSALTDVILAALRGAQGAVFTFGQPHLGQMETMVGSCCSAHTLGVMPSALSWLYKSIQEINLSSEDENVSWQVKISALQLTSGDVITDLLEGDEYPKTPSTGESKSLLSSVAQASAPTLQDAANILDTALAARQVDEFGRVAHMVFTLNIYKNNSDVCWGRFHLIDLGPVDRSSRGIRSVTLSTLGNTILAIINGHKQPAQKEAQLGLLGSILRECVSSLRCVTSIIVHVSAEPHKYQDTLATIQLATRVHRLRRRRIKPQIGGSGSGGSSEESKSGRSSRGTITDTGSSSMDPSSSEMSCDTVIYVGPGADDATDTEHPPVYLPSTASPDNRCSIRKALRGSIVDTTTNVKPETLKSQRKNTPKKSPKHSSVSLNKENVSSPSKTKEKNKTRSDGDKDKTDRELLDSSDAQVNSKTICRHCNHSGKSGSNSSPKYKQNCTTLCKHRKSASNNNNGTQNTNNQGPSDEQWVDGPRFHKSKVLEGQKIKSNEIETWIDGPEATYGYMDDVKKTMVQKWVETQNSQTTKKESSPSKSPKKNAYYKELTQFKTSETEEASPKHRDKIKDKRKHSESKESKREKQNNKDSPHRRKSLNETTLKRNDDDQEHQNMEKRNHLSMSKHINQVPVKSLSNGSSLSSPKTLKESLKSTSSPHKTNADLSSEKSHSSPTTKLQSKISPNNSPRIISSVVDDKSSVQSPDLESQKVVVGSKLSKDKEEKKTKVKCVVSSELNDTGVPKGASNDQETQKTSSITESKTEVSLKDDDDSKMSVISDEGNSISNEEFAENKVYLTQLSSQSEAWDDYEFIEVEEPVEPVELVDSWTQVSEEDLFYSAASYSMLSPPLRLSGLAPVQEEVEPTTDSLEEESENGSEVRGSLNNKESCNSSVADFSQTNAADSIELGQLDGDMCEIGKHTSTKFEEMIQTPNFTAKTHYFAERLEELRKLHQFYKNLAKQAPRRNSTNLSSLSNGFVLPDLLNMPSDEAIISDVPIHPADPFLVTEPILNNQGALSSLNIESNYNFDWKSLLPDEIDIGSECGDGRVDLDETASDVSKDISETVYDIQSDIMPYLPSNYISLSSLSASKPPDLIMTNYLNTCQLSKSPEIKNNDDIKNVSPKIDSQEKIQTNNITSLSDDETNVKHIKNKKEKRKKKSSLTSPSKRISGQTEPENSNFSTFGKINWGRFFGSSPKKGNSSKESPKKSSKNSKSSNKFSSSSSKNGEKMEKRVKEQRISSREPRIHGDIEVPKSTLLLPFKGEADTKVKSSKNSTGRKSSSTASKNSTNGSHKRDSSRESIHTKNSNKQERDSVSSLYKCSKQDLSGRSRNTFQRDSLCVHPGTSSTNSSVIYHGYDSGADSGVGMRTSSRASRSRSHTGSLIDPRHGESSGYESVIRDSECSSFGSSQDSGLDDLEATGAKKIAVKQQKPEDHKRQKSSSELPSLTDGAYHAGYDVCDSVDLEANIPEMNRQPIPSGVEDQIEQYSEEHVNRLEHRRQCDREEDQENRASESEGVMQGSISSHQEDEIDSLRQTQSRLKVELEAAKKRLMIDESRWSYELHVEKAMSADEEGFIEALEAETTILQKRVLAASSHCQIESSFLNGKKENISFSSFIESPFRCKCLSDKCTKYCGGLNKIGNCENGENSKKSSTSILKSPLLFRRKKSLKVDKKDSTKATGIDL